MNEPVDRSRTGSRRRVVLRPAAVLLALLWLAIVPGPARSAPAGPAEIETLLREAKADFRSGRRDAAEAAFAAAYQQAADALLHADTTASPADTVALGMLAGLQRAALQGLTVIRLDGLEEDQRRLAAELEGLAAEPDTGDPHRTWARLRALRTAVDSTITGVSEIPRASWPMALSAQGTSGERLARFVVESERLRGIIRDRFLSVRIRIFADLEGRLRAARAETAIERRREELSSLLADADSILAEPRLESDFREAIEMLAAQAREALAANGGSD